MSRGITIVQRKTWEALPGFWDVQAKVRCEPLPYAKAQTLVRKAGIKTLREFRAWKRIEGVPSTPDKTYKAKGWKNWPEFLGTGVPFIALPYAEAQTLVRKAGIKTVREFRAWKRPEGVPRNPNETYKNKGWKNWFEFLGTGVPFVALSYAEVQRLVKKAGIKTWREFKAWKRPEGVPSHPDENYEGKGWTNWPEFFDREPLLRRQS